MCSATRGARGSRRSPAARRATARWTASSGGWRPTRRPAGPENWKITDVIATASLIGGIFGKGGGRELDSALLLQEAQSRFGADGGRQVWEDLRRAEDPEAPVTVQDTS